MRCIELAGAGGPEVLRPALRPRSEAAAGEVLIEVHAAGVNRPDVLQRLGGYAPPPGASDLPGLEVAGRVVAVGPGCRRFCLGDAVCALVSGGGYAEFVNAPEPQVLPVPDGYSMVEAAGVPETFFTVWTNVFERGALKPGEWLLVHGGTSGIGTTAIQLARVFGARVLTTVGNRREAGVLREARGRAGDRLQDRGFHRGRQGGDGGPRRRRHPRHGRWRLRRAKPEGARHGGPARADRLARRRENRGQLRQP